MTVSRKAKKIVRSPMDNEQTTLESQEELNAEKEIVVEPSEDDLREKIAEEEGLDLESDADLLDRIVKREKAHRQKLSKAIEQKRKYREQLFSTKKPEVKPQSSTKETPDVEALVEQKFNERMEKRDLESLDLPENLQEEVKRIAKIEGISVREAAKHPYFVFKKAEYEKEERIKNATPSRKGGSKYLVDPSVPLNPADFDFSKPEDVERWKAAKAARAKAQS